MTAIVASNLDAAMAEQERYFQEAAQRKAGAVPFPLPKGSSVPERHFPEPVPASELGPGAAVDWIWDGFLARGHTTLFNALWKSGKTTLLSHALKAMGEGGNLAGVIRKARALVVSEESASLWASRRDDLGITDNIEFCCRPFKTRPNRAEWERFVEHLEQLVKRRRFDMVALDTVAALLPLHDENDAAGMGSALLPLNGVTGAGAAVMLIHHPKKHDAGEGQASRGSGALPGYVDIIMEMRRFNPEERDDRRRTLTGYSRFEETPTELVIELGDDGYRLVGGKVEARQEDRLDVIGGILPESGPGFVVEEVRKLWPEGDGVPRPGNRTLRADLEAGVKAGRWRQAGSGRKGDPLRFSANSFPARSICKGAESNLDLDPVDQRVLEFARGA